MTDDSWDSFFLGLLIGSLGVFVALPCHAGVSATVHWGFEKNALSVGVGHAERHFSLGVVCELPANFLVKTEAGFWLNADPTPSRQTSFHAEVQPGYRVANPLGVSGLAFDVYLGPAWVAKPDDYTGTRWEIAHEIDACYRGHDGKALCVGWAHWSNTGLFTPDKPNLGRDAGLVRGLIPL